MANNKKVATLYPPLSQPHAVSRGLKKHENDPILSLRFESLGLSAFESADQVYKRIAVRGSVSRSIQAMHKSFHPGKTADKLSKEAVESLLKDNSPSHSIVAGRINVNARRSATFIQTRLTTGFVIKNEIVHPIKDRLLETHNFTNLKKVLKKKGTVPFISLLTDKEKAGFSLRGVSSSGKINIFASVQGEGKVDDSPHDKEIESAFCKSPLPKIDREETETSIREALPPQIACKSAKKYAQRCT